MKAKPNFAAINTTAFRLALVTPGLLAVLVACAATGSQPESAQVKPHNAPSAKTSEFPATATGQSRTTSANETLTDNWAKARAVYLRSLDYAKIEQQDNPRDQYLVKSNLIESRYHIKDSENALYVEHNLPKALQELRAAEKQYNQALSTAPAKHRDPLTNTKSDLDALLEQEESLTHNCCRYPPRDAYTTIEASIENLLSRL